MPFRLFLLKNDPTWGRFLVEALCMDRLKMLETMVDQKAEAFPRYALAMEYRKLSRHEDSAAQFEILLEEYADYLPSYLMYAQLLASMSQAEKAVGILDRGIEVATRAKDDHTLGELMAEKEALS